LLLLIAQRVSRGLRNIRGFAGGSERKRCQIVHMGRNPMSMRGVVSA